MIDLADHHDVSVGVDEGGRVELFERVLGDREVRGAGQRRGRGAEDARSSVEGVNCERGHRELQSVRLHVVDARERIGVYGFARPLRARDHADRDLDRLVERPLRDHQLEHAIGARERTARRAEIRAHDLPFGAGIDAAIRASGVFVTRVGPAPVRRARVVAAGVRRSVVVSAA